MVIESTLFDLLTDDAGVAALVSTRVWPSVLPQNPTLPAIVYQEARTNTRVMADGDSGGRESRFLLSAWATSYGVAKDCKAAVVAAINGVAGSGIERIAIDAMRDDYDPETKWYRQMIEIVIHWIE